MGLCYGKFKFELIFRSDWMTKYKATLNFKRTILFFHHMGHPSYPIPFAYKEEVMLELFKKQKTDISQLMLVEKEDGTVSCLDFRLLNSLMANDFVNPPNPAHLLLNFKY